MKPCSTKGCPNVTDRIHGQCRKCVAEFGRRSRLEQGKSEFIDDPVFLDALAASITGSPVALASTALLPATDRVVEANGAAGPDGQRNAAVRGSAARVATRAVGTPGRSSSL